MNDTWPPPPDRKECPTSSPLHTRHRFWEWLFEVRTEDAGRWSIVTWWEKRRLAYNLIAGGVGVVSLVLFEVIMSAPGMLGPGEDAVEPMALILAPIAMNICYTAGWVCELGASILVGKGTHELGPKLLKAGMIFSLIVVWIPTIAAAIRLLTR